MAGGTRSVQNRDTRFENDSQWKSRTKNQLAQVKLQLNQKYTEINVMKSQKALVEQKLNNLLGK